MERISDPVFPKMLMRNKLLQHSRSDPLFTWKTGTLGHFPFARWSRATLKTAMFFLPKNPRRRRRNVIYRLFLQTPCVVAISRDIYLRVIPRFEINRPICGATQCGLAMKIQKQLKDKLNLGLD